MSNDDLNRRYAPMAEMNFGPPQMSMTSGPRLTYGTIISSTQLFTQAQWHSLVSSSSSGSSNPLPRPFASQSPGPSTSGTGSKDEQRIDSARREWERATPENLRRVQAKDLRKILSSNSAGLGPSVLASTSSSARLDFSAYITGHELTVPLLSSPRLIKRPFDPLICENMILSRATALVPLPTRSASRGSSPGAQSKTADGKSRSPSRDGTGNGAAGSDPWFDSMDENNTRLALELNLVLTLCQALEGVRSPRLAVRDRQLIVRETATELGIFFEFLEHRAQRSEWRVAASLVDSGTRRSRLVAAPEQLDRRLPARISEGATVHKVPVAQRRVSTAMETLEEGPAEEPEREARSREEVVTTGGFKVPVDTSKFLQLLGKLLKSVVESLDSAQFG
jgi:nuclear pore complex protein Nup188